MLGSKVSHYWVTEKLGEGGMGVVYKAEDLTLRRAVALKFLAPQSLNDPDAKERFLREARAAAGLDHPNVCTVYEAGEHGGQAFLAMALIKGQTVKSKIAERPLPLDDALSIAIQAGEGLRAAHGAGIVHRDINSANLMVSADGAVKVMDFGLAQLAGQSGLTRSRTTLGTAAYMSPEQARSEPVDRRTDIWSLGVVLYEMVAGRLPFEGGHEAAALYAIIHTKPEPVTALRSGLPQALDRVLDKAMTKDPDGRYQNMADLLVDLRALRKGLPVTAPSRVARRNLLIGAAAAGAGAVGIAIGFRTGNSPTRISSMVVLPLENLSGNPEQEYFADGMTDALTTDLSKIGSLRVISRQSAMRYKGSRKPLTEIAKELKVDAIVGGSVAREGGRVRVTAHLIDAATDQNLWAESYERDLASVLSLQAEVARTIAGKVRVAVRPEEQAHLAQNRKVNPETYEAYLKGSFWLSKGTPEAFDKAVAFFQEAVDIDPADPLAYAGLAMGYMTAGHLTDSPDYRVPRARAAAQKALQLDDANADAHLALAVIEGYRDFQWQAAEKRIKRSLELNPNSSFGHFHMGWLHYFHGRAGEAIAAGNRALELDPLSVPHHWIFDFYRTAGRYNEAIAKCQQALESNPKIFTARFVLGSTYSDMGRHEEALAEIRKGVEIAPNLRGYLGMVYARAGRAQEARKILAEYEAVKLTGWTAWWRALISILLGNKEEAVRMLLFTPHHDWLAGIWVDPSYKPLRGDPRYEALVTRMNLPRV
jgi:serine/threonine-protein kinase